MPALRFSVSLDAIMISAIAALLMASIYFVLYLLPEIDIDDEGGRPVLPDGPAPDPDPVAPSAREVMSAPSAKE